MSYIQATGLGEGSNLKTNYIIKVYNSFPFRECQVPTILRLCIYISPICKLKKLMAPQILGLSTCADTIIGDELQRGISGGQKKRTTIGKYFILELVSSLFELCKLHCKSLGCKVYDLSTEQDAKVGFVVEFDSNYLKANMCSPL